MKITKKVFFISLFCLLSIFTAQRGYAAITTQESRTISTANGSFDIVVVKASLNDPLLHITTTTKTKGGCDNNCEVQSLKDYVTGVENGVAGINGSYFCPADYASCQGSTGSSFWFWYDSATGTSQNLDHTPFNDKGPLIAFDTQNNYYWYDKASDWPGEDQFEIEHHATLSAAFSSGPNLVLDNNVVVTASELDAKQTTVKSNRSAFGILGNDVVLVVARSATVLDLGQIMYSLGCAKAVNLDGGGSSALYNNGQYLVGPGRDIPNALILSEKKVVRPPVAGKEFYAYDKNLNGGYTLTVGNVQGTDKKEIIVGTATGLGPQIRIFNEDGKLLSSFFAFNSNHRYGVVVSSCNINSDPYDEIIVAEGKGSLPKIKIFNYNGRQLGKTIMVLDGKFTGGVEISCGQLNRDGRKEIVVAAQKGGGPQVMIYDTKGKVLANFFAYNKFFGGGISITTADADNDGIDEIITGPQNGAPHIQIFKPQNNTIKQLSPGFFAFSNDYRGGVNLGNIDLLANKKRKIMVGVGEDAEPYVKIYGTSGKLYKNFLAYHSDYLGGVMVAAGDIDGDNIEEIIVAPRSASSPIIRIIKISDI